MALDLDKLSKLGRQWRAARNVIAKQIADQVKAEEFDDDQVAEVADLFDDWEAGLDVEVGEVYRWDGTLVEVIQAHTTQADWTPDLVPALFKIHRTPDMVEWQAGISVSVGEEFTYQGSTYRVLQAHTTQQGWTPDVTPALWELI